MQQCPIHGFIGVSEESTMLSKKLAFSEETAVSILEFGGRSEQLDESYRLGANLIERLWLRIKEVKLEISQPKEIMVGEPLYRDYNAQLIAFFNKQRDLYLEYLRQGGELSQEDGVFTLLYSQLRHVGMGGKIEESPIGIPSFIDAITYISGISDCIERLGVNDFEKLRKILLHKKTRLIILKLMLHNRKISFSVMYILCGDYYGKYKDDYIEFDRDKFELQIGEDGEYFLSIKDILFIQEKNVSYKKLESYLIEKITQEGGEKSRRCPVLYTQYWTEIYTWLVEQLIIFLKNESASSQKNPLRYT